MGSNPIPRIKGDDKIAHFFKYFPGYYFTFNDFATREIFAVPVGIFLVSRAEITLAFIGVAVLFLPLCLFLPKLIQRGLHADVDVVIEALGKNEQVKRVFWTLFVAMAGVVLAQVVDPVTARVVVRIITGMGVCGIELQHTLPHVFPSFFKTHFEIIISSQPFY